VTEALADALAATIDDRVAPPQGMRSTAASDALSIGPGDTDETTISLGLSGIARD
jgi:hypothetical protein